MKWLRILSSVLFAMLITTSGALAQTRDFSIPPGDLKTVLDAFTRQSGAQLVYRIDEVVAVQSNGVTGTLSADAALARILEGTGFTSHRDSSGALAVIRERESRGEKPRAAADPQEKIIVTAQKRSELLTDVPVPVTAINANTLVENNQLGIKEYFTRVPGLMFTSGNRGEPFVVIRGVTTTPLTVPTVGITVDDLPFGSSTVRGGGFIVPDMDPSDLARVEVLRGPQGTLYGVSSLGGLIKYVAVDPSTEALSGRIQTGISAVHNGHELGYNLRGAINVPLSETLAVRASGFTRLEPGYIDNPALNLEGVNRGDAAGGRLSLLWRPSDAFTLKLGALSQERNADGSSLVFQSPGLGDLQQSYLRGSGWYRTKFQAYSATLSAMLAGIDLTSLTGYNVTRIRDSVDTSVFFRGLASTNFGVTGAPISDNYKTEKFTQEVRISAPIGARLEWLLGGFYTNEKSRNVQQVTAVDPATGIAAGVVGTSFQPSTYEEFAGFTDLTVHFTDRFDVQIGGRKSHNRQTTAETDTGLQYGAGIVIPTLVVTDSPFTYLVTPRFKVSPDLMVYSRFASGYRAGGFNTAAGRGQPVPPGYGADKTQNYEIGVKGDVLERALSFDASLYYIDWKDVQLLYLTPAGFSFTVNAGQARSKGAELTLESHPLTGLTIAAAASWSDAQLATDFGPRSPVLGLSGDRLPFSSKFAGSLSLDQRIPLLNGWIGSVGATVSYVGDRKGVFRPPAAPQRQDYPAYAQVDVRAGLKLESWAVNAFVTNLTDKRGLLGGGLGAISPVSFNITTPRTVGVSASKTF